MKTPASRNQLIVRNLEEEVVREVSGMPRSMPGEDL